MAAAIVVMVLLTAWLILWPMWQKHQALHSLKIILDGKHGVGVSKDTILVAGSVFAEVSQSVTQIGRERGGRALGMIVEDEELEEDVRLMAAHILADMGVDDQSAFPALALATNTANANVRSAAMRTLPRLQQECVTNSGDESRDGSPSRGY